MKEEEDTILCLYKKIEYGDFFDRQERAKIRNLSKIKHKILYLKSKEIIYFKSSIIYKVKHFSYIQIGLNIIYPERNINKMKLKLIGNISDGIDLIKTFKKMNNVLLIVKKNWERIVCVYQKDVKGTYLNQFILFIFDTRDENYIYYANKNINRFLENDKLSNCDDFSEKFSEVMKDFEENMDKKEYAELFRIY